MIVACTICYNLVFFAGQFLLTHLLLDVLKESAPSRIVCVGAVAYKLGSINLDDINYETEEYTPGKAYARSKLALTLFVRKLAEELKGRWQHWELAKRFSKL